LILLAGFWRRRGGSSLFLGINISPGVHRMNHSQFTDDTILLGGASTIIAYIFKLALDSFTKASRGLVNDSKSNIYEWNISRSLTTQIARILHFEYEENWKSFKYLGIPISLKLLPFNYWLPILDKIKKKNLLGIAMVESGWKNHVN
jgi:hypothetical protein